MPEGQEFNSGNIQETANTAGAELPAEVTGALEGMLANESPEFKNKFNEKMNKLADVIRQKLDNDWEESNKIIDQNSHVDGESFGESMSKSKSLIRTQLSSAGKIMTLGPLHSFA